MVERARVILACLEGKEIQQVARELRVSVVAVSRWRSRFALFGIRGLQDGQRPGNPHIRIDTLQQRQNCWVPRPIRIRMGPFRLWLGRFCKRSL